MGHVNRAVYVTWDLASNCAEGWRQTFAEEDIQNCKWRQTHKANKLDKRKEMINVKTVSTEHQHCFKNGAKSAFYFLFPVWFSSRTHLSFSLSPPDTNICLTPTYTNYFCLPPITLPLASINFLSSLLISFTLFASYRLCSSSPPFPNAPIRIKGSSGRL